MTKLTSYKMGVTEMPELQADHFISPSLSFSLTNLGTPNCTPGREKRLTCHGEVVAGTGSAPENGHVRVTGTSPEKISRRLTSELNAEHREELDAMDNKVDRL